jgi:predicted  nucleic acid-binding Zn-ribbon protein
MELEFLNNLMVSSPLVGVMLFIVYKLWMAYVSEVQYNKTRDLENIKIYTDLTHLVETISQNLIKVNDQISSISEKNNALSNDLARISDKMADILNELRRIGETNKRA